jgi:WD40 repeat protein
MFTIDGGLAPSPPGVRDRYRTVALDGGVAWLGGDAGSIHRWDMDAGTVTSFEGDGSFVTALAADRSSGGVIFGTRDGTVGRIGEDGTTALAAHSDLVWSIEWSPAGDIVATTSADNTIVLRDPVTLQPVQAAFGPAPSPGGKGLKGQVFVDETTLATAGFDGHVRIWDTASGTQTMDVVIGDQEVNAITVLPGRRVAAGDELGTITIIDVDSGAIVATIEDTAGAVRTLAVSPDGETLARGGADDAVRLWTLDDLTEVGIFAHGGAVRSLVYTDDGAQILAVDNSGGALVWDARWQTWPDALCDWLSFWDVERSWPRVMGDAAYSPVCD